MINYESLLIGISLIPTYYLWQRLYNTYHQLNEEYKEAKLFNERHNCVVMYNKMDATMRGWPPEYKVTVSKNNLHKFIEPFVYFLKTTKHDVSIAMMRIATPPLFDAIHELVERGVKVRIIVNFLSVVSVKENFKKILKAGVKVAFFVDDTENLNKIMHYKYMVKDHDVNNGYLCMGSMNITTISSLINNFEDCTFTSAKSAVDQFYDDFEKSWNTINRHNSKEYNKVVLRDAGLL